VNEGLFAASNGPAHIPPTSKAINDDERMRWIKAFSVCHNRVTQAYKALIDDGKPQF
jgi:hypothetical protein